MKIGKRFQRVSGRQSIVFVCISTFLGFYGNSYDSTRALLNNVGAIRMGGRGRYLSNKITYRNRTKIEIWPRSIYEHWECACVFMSFVFSTNLSIAMSSCSAWCILCICWRSYIIFVMNKTPRHSDWWHLQFSSWTIY